ncbi:MBL fold metallo-hydrolase [Pseudomonas nitroreducens]|uniref:MBL fold metallo-hydrolase n=1 Tax=Pseudomonas nitroreducens TaxID=46680 RepID=UPI0023F958AA|nr:MBL fold metallo-hydrolase [Pseudomonas nitroreducens]WEW96272.1 MBL fold metallo-hydrolase [Pseudomonas nitroreducens]
MPASRSNPCLTLLASTLLVSTFAWAEPPAAPKTQAPGYFRLAVGDYEVTALYDGYNDLSPGLLLGLSRERIGALLARSAMGDERVQTNFNAFLVNTGKHLVLVDSGAGQCIGGTAGHLPENMKAAGYAPEQVDSILLTHMHLDHVCGLVDGQGRALFANATVYATQAEADYWLDEKRRDQAPEKAREFFQVAQQSLAPYRATNRLRTFVPPASPLPELQTEATSGHTPGSTSYRFESGGEAIVFIGDLIHNVAVQFAHPEVAIRFDTDPKQAVKAREAEFGALAKNGAWVAAAHLPFPGIGHITRDGKAFNWAPAVYGPYQRAQEVPFIQ